MKENKYPDMDLTKLRFDVKEKAKALLYEVTNENIEAFLQAVKLITEGFMEQYVFLVYDLYAKGTRKISDIDLLDTFLDSSEGYQGKMLKWIKDNPIQFREHTIDNLVPPQEMKICSHRPIATIGIGSVIAIGLCIYNKVLIALAAELITVALAYKQKQANEKKQEIYNNQLKEYQIKLTRIRRDLINNLTADLEKWLEKGKAYSDSILTSYNF